MASRSSPHAATMRWRRAKSSRSCSCSFMHSFSMLDWQWDSMSCWNSIAASISLTFRLATCKGMRPSKCRLTVRDAPLSSKAFTVGASSSACFIRSNTTCNAVHPSRRCLLTSTVGCFKRTLRAFLVLATMRGVDPSSFPAFTSAPRAISSLIAFFLNSSSQVWAHRCSSVFPSDKGVLTPTSRAILGAWRVPATSSASEFPCASFTVRSAPAPMSSTLTSL
mmetsp:Transcript_29223/g.73510  ORF Transcript_29223/g.73510 Transcript_29223/m.73510 type:complete len:222 (-) Transcript_29223:346-1011(-)